MQQLQALWLQVNRRKAHAGDIAAGAAETCHETTGDRIAAGDEDDRYGRGGSPGRVHSDILGNNHGRLAARQIRREPGKPIGLVLSPAEIDRHVVAIDQTSFLQSVAECRWLVLSPAEIDRHVVAIDQTSFLQSVAECRYPVE